MKKFIVFFKKEQNPIEIYATRQDAATRYAKRKYKNFDYLITSENLTK